MRRKIVFASHDPGGFNLLFPIINSFAALEELELHLLLIGNSLSRYQAMPHRSSAQLHFLKTFPVEQFPKELDVQRNDVTTILNTIQPSIIITATSINSNIERYCIAYGNNLKIPVLTIIDSWVGENVRFKSKLITAYPGTIMVIDQAMADRCKVFEKEGCRILVVGNPHLEALYIKNFTRIINQKADTSRVLFFSENIYHYYPDDLINEYSIIESILDHCDLIELITIAIRPHPLESHDKWKKFIFNNSSRNPKIRLEIDEIPFVEESILKSKLTFGISSMALIESTVFQKPTFSYQIDLKSDNKMLYIPFDEFKIVRLKNMDDVCSMLSSKQNLNMVHCKTETVSAIEKIKEIVKELGVKIE